MRIPLFPEPRLSREGRWFLLVDGVLLVLLMLFVSYEPNVYDQGMPPVELPVASVLSENPPYEIEQLILTVTRDGRVWQGRKAMDADQLRQWLDSSVLAHDRRRRAVGKSGFDDIGAGARASKLAVLLRVDRAASWGAVLDVLVRVGQSSLYKVQFLVAHGARDRSKLQAFLPAADQDEAHITARVRPGSVTIDGREVADLTGAIKAAYRVLRDRDRRAAGLIDAERDTPFGDVIRALDAFACAGVERVDLAADGVRAVGAPR